MLRIKLALYFNVLCEAESIKTAGYQLFKKYHDFFFIQPAGLRTIVFRADRWMLR
jgi:hypothetical protein